MVSTGSKWATRKANCGGSASRRRTVSTGSKREISLAVSTGSNWAIFSTAPAFVQASTASQRAVSTGSKLAILSTAEGES